MWRTERLSLSRVIAKVGCEEVYAPEEQQARPGLKMLKGPNIL
jgi:hypothetical protein